MKILIATTMAFLSCAAMAADSSTESLDVKRATDLAQAAAIKTYTEERREKDQFSVEVKTFDVKIAPQEHWEEHKVVNSNQAAKVVADAKQAGGACHELAADKIVVCHYTGMANFGIDWKLLNEASTKGEVKFPSDNTSVLITDQNIKTGLKVLNNKAITPDSGVPVNFDGLNGCRYSGELTRPQEAWYAQIDIKACGDLIEKVNLVVPLGYMHEPICQGNTFGLFPLIERLPTGIPKPNSTILADHQVQAIKKCS
jgi:hypothetical protein